MKQKMIRILVIGGISGLLTYFLLYIAINYAFGMEMSFNLKLLSTFIFLSIITTILLFVIQNKLLDNSIISSISLAILGLLCGSLVYYFSVYPKISKTENAYIFYIISGALRLFNKVCLHIFAK